MRFVCFVTLEVAATYRNVQLGIGTGTYTSAISFAFGIDKIEAENKLKHLGDC